MARQPEAPAVVEPAGCRSYAELAADAGGLGELLRAGGAGPGERVGLLLPKGARAVAAILGTLATGAAYVPLDPAYPRERLVRMVRDSGVAALLTDASAADTAADLASGLASDGAPVRVLRAEDAGGGELRPAARDCGDPAYLLYTSGSTGLPKGVAQSERSLLHCAANQIAALRITAADRLSLIASLSFDAAVPDLFPALLTGAALVPLDVRDLGPSGLAAALAEHRVGVYHSTPTVYRYLLDALGPQGRLPEVRGVLLGGERATRADVLAARGRFRADCVVVNGYGATEATFCAHHAVAPDDLAALDEGPLPVGRPLPGYDIVLDDGSGGASGQADEAAPGGRGDRDGRTDADEGEIVVRSEHVALGYWRDDERTAERFGVGPDGVRRYRTGDLGRRLPDGRLVCLGRIDRQIKVRGLRVEPGEVEAVLDALPGVERSVVVARGEELLAYVQGPAAPDAARLRRCTADVLPGHMVPSRFTAVPELPLTASGKVDVLALPDPDATAGDAGAVPHDAAPLTAAEAAVAAAWREVLGVPHIAPDTGFFDAGGHSLLLGVLRDRLALRFGRVIPLPRLLAAPTIRGHAGLYADDADRYEIPDASPAEPSRGADPRPYAPAPGPVPPADDAPSRTAEPAPYPPEQPDAAGGTGEEIAVVGMAGRFPGAASVDALWRNLCAGVDAIHDYGEDELRALGIGPGLLADPRHVRSGGRVAHVEDFDAELFGFDDAEAALTDPQHRLFLECAWEALEDAGCDPRRHDGTVGVFTSASVNRYFLFHLLGNPALGAVDPDDWEGRLTPHQLPDHLPGQAAYRLGLTGPALGVQSACSGSLAAVCLAAQGLADYRMDVALAGGVSVTWPRHRCTERGAVSPDGRTRAFSDDAQGAGYSSGAGVVVLKRLADALADGDVVHAVIPGWALANDGAARAGFAVPGVAGQAAAVAEALADAGVDPAGVGFVEAHGSGTPLGDAIEVEALNQAFREAGDLRVAGCALGAVKTGVGHLDAAAGVTGLIKAVLAVREGRIPGNLHFRAPNPEIDFAAGPFRIPVRTEEWPGPRRVAGVNALGLGGANAHVVVAQAPDRAPRPAGPARTTWRLALSAQTPAALRACAQRLRDHLIAHPDLALDDVEHTLATGRRVLPCRAVVECTGAADAIEALRPERLRADACAAWPEGTSGRRVRLPTYPFQRRRHWIDPPRNDVRGTTT